MHFIVSGGAGFIGSHLVEKLISENHQVTVIDNLSTGKIQNLLTSPKLTFIQQDILSYKPEKLADRYDGLVHLAATPSVTQSWLDPLAAHHNNASATVAAIQLCHLLKIPRLVFASSAAVYGNPAQIPLSEDSPVSPISPYGLQKLAGEQYIELFSKHFGFSSVKLRLFNVFGPRQDPRSPYSGVISIFAKAMMAGKPICINGDGTQTRDFIYVKDVASAFAQALTTPLESGSSLTCNVGTGGAISLLELKEELQFCFPQWTAGTTFAAPRLGDIQDSQADIAKAKLYLGFEPQFSLRNGLQALKESLYMLHSA